MTDESTLSQFSMVVCIQFCLFETIESILSSTWNCILTIDNDRCIWLRVYVGGGVMCCISNCARLHN